MSVSAADAETATHRQAILKWISRRFPSPTAGFSEKLGHKRALRSAGILWQKTDDGAG
jgi:hypothetical protein